MNVTLTSHFAGNKVTLYDFQLAERMNKDYQIAAKNFKMFPYFQSNTWSSIFVALGTFFVIANVLGFAIGIQNPYPSSLQRDPPKLYSPRPYVVDPWEMPEDIKDVKTKEDYENFIERHTDDYSFKTSLFRSRGLF